jgi:glycosyltransferase involved in cell wall biosynthesis
MRIGIDARELCGERTGVGRYLAAVLEGWRTLPAAASHDLVLCAHAPLPDVDLAPLRVEVRTAPGRGGTLWEQLRLPGVLRAAQVDVVFSPAYTAPLWAPAPVVLAMHDVSFAAHPEWFPKRSAFRRRVLAGRAARQAARVLTLTEFSRAEIQKWLGVPARRIAVVPPGVTAWPGVTDGAPKRSGANVLYVGSIFTRRHVPELFEAVATLAARRPEVTLTVIGHDRTTPPADLDALAGRLGLRPRLTRHDWIDDAALAQCYRDARAFAFLSEYEGFGLTPLEALAAGLPPVVVDTPVAREACGPAAVYVARPDPAAVADALEAALFDEATRARVHAAAPAVLGRYSWRTCAASVLESLELAGRR